jgi:hypothetical protein
MAKLLLFLTFLTVELMTANEKALAADPLSIAEVRLPGILP